MPLGVGTICPSLPCNIKILSRPGDRKLFIRTSKTWRGLQLSCFVNRRALRGPVSFRLPMKIESDHRSANGRLRGPVRSRIRGVVTHFTPPHGNV